MVEFNDIIKAIGIEPYYRDNQKDIVIYCADCRDILPLIPDKSIDLVLTDPPYGIGKMEWDIAFPDWCVDLSFKVANTVCIMSGIWQLGHCIQLFGDRYKWVLCGRNLNGINQRGAIGFNGWIPAIVGGDNIKKGQDVFDFSVNGGINPCGKFLSRKPDPFITWLCHRITDATIIIDPFLGSGTTLISAKKLNIKAIGIELNKEYADIAVKRLAQGVLW